MANTPETNPDQSKAESSNPDQSISESSNNDLENLRSDGSESNEEPQTNSDEIKSSKDYSQSQYGSWYKNKKDSKEEEKKEFIPKIISIFNQLLNDGFDGITKDPNKKLLALLIILLINLSIFIALGTYLKNSNLMS